MAKALVLATAVTRFEMASALGQNSLRRSRLLDERSGLFGTSGAGGTPNRLPHISVHPAETMADGQS